MPRTSGHPGRATRVCRSGWTEAGRAASLWLQRSSELWLIMTSGVGAEPSSAAWRTHRSELHSERCWCEPS
eukprot:10230683-Lingulodinium_polyedra.AAC.1